MAGAGDLHGDFRTRARHPCGNGSLAGDPSSPLLHGTWHPLDPPLHPPSRPLHRRRRHRHNRFLRRRRFYPRAAIGLSLAGTFTLQAYSPWEAGTPGEGTGPAVEGSGRKVGLRWKADTSRRDFSPFCVILVLFAANSLIRPARHGGVGGGMLGSIAHGSRWGSPNG
jgi:hypothetical protein